jgi:hypothetical protein
MAPSSSFPFFGNNPQHFPAETSPPPQTAMQQQGYYAMQPQAYYAMPQYYNPYQTVSYQTGGYYYPSYPSYYYPMYAQYYGQTPYYWYQGR